MRDGVRDMTESLDLMATADRIETLAGQVRAVHARSGRIEDNDAVFHLYTAAYEMRRAFKRMAALRAEQAAADAAPKKRTLMP